MKTKKQRFTFLLLVCLLVLLFIYLRTSRDGSDGSLTLYKADRDVARDEWTKHGPSNLALDLTPRDINQHNSSHIAHIATIEPHRHLLTRPSHHSTDLIHNILTKEHKTMLKVSPRLLNAVSLSSRSLSHPHSSMETGVEKVLDNVRTCLAVTNMSQLADESIALTNAEYFYREFRKVVPATFLANYSSHCWSLHYDVAITRSVNYQGHLGNKTLAGSLLTRTFILMNPLSTLTTSFGGNFSTELVCLPHMFLVGFPKCGSTYTWCFMGSLIRRHLSLSSASEIEKEPRFWVKHAASIPKATDLGEYLLNFLPGLKAASENIDVPFMDGSPSTIFNRPRFNLKQPDSVNYCLIPSVLPELLQKSKYVVVMRNPISMLYSEFWWSCTIKSKVHTARREAQLEGPILFHQRTMAKIELFNSCMRDDNSVAPCSVYNTSDYSSCIMKRLHLLDQCVDKIRSNSFGGLLPKCGRSRVHVGLYYTHIRKWLSVVPRKKMFFLTLEELVTEPRNVAKEMLEFLGYQPRDDLFEEIEHITGSCSRNAQSKVDYKHDPQLRMRKDTKELLETFFQPFNF